MALILLTILWNYEKIKVRFENINSKTKEELCVKNLKKLEQVFDKYDI